MMNVFLEEDDLGLSKGPLCREPWESYYILRRGILPCCHGIEIAPMEDWEKTWNSPLMKEIRKALSGGKLSDYCRERLGCPIVQRYLEKERERTFSKDGILVPQKALPLRILNRMLFKVPGKIYRFLKRRRQKII